MKSRFSPKTDILISRRQDEVHAYMAPDVQKSAPHFHYQYELLLNVGGTAEFDINGKRYQTAPGSLLFMSNLENHCILSHSKGYDRYTLRFSSEALVTYLRDPLLLSIFKQRPDGFIHQYFCTAEEFSRYRRLVALIEQEYRMQNPYWDQMISTKLLTILVEMYRHHPEAFPAFRNAEEQGLVFDVQNYIEAHVQEDLSLDAVAARFFINKYHLSHCFSRVTGYTFKQFIIMARISKAKDLLLNTTDEIAAVSEAVGFHNVSHFIRAFKKLEQISPLRYRNRAKQPKAEPSTDAL